MRKWENVKSWLKFGIVYNSPYKGNWALQEYALQFVFAGDFQFRWGLTVGGKQMSQETYKAIYAE